MTTVGLVGCAAAKLKRPAPARELYTSALFRKSSAYVEHHTDRWYILSAKHGLLHPDQVVEPNNMKLGRNQALPIWDWAAMVNEQLVRELSGVPNVRRLVLAGEHYRTVLRRTPFPYDVPMQGLGIGEQLGFLTRATLPVPVKLPPRGEPERPFTALCCEAEVRTDHKRGSSGRRVRARTP